MLYFMLMAALSRTLFLALTIGVAAAGLAAEFDPLASPEYRLRIDNPDAFRLAASVPHTPPAPAPRDESAIASRFADRPFATLIDSAAREAALDPALVHAVIFVESGYNPAARSPKGAIGLMQVMPATASRYGVPDPARSPHANLRAGTRYLSDLVQQFDGRLELVLAAYNAGENAVLRHGQRIPPYRETQQYVPAVLAKYREWQKAPSPPAEPEALPVSTLPVSTHIEYMPGTRLDPDYLRAANGR